MKKGQAGIEFLMTYGWAILVVIAAIVALVYFGVLDPANLLPEEVTTLNETNETFEKYCLEWNGWIKRERLTLQCEVVSRLEYKNLSCEYKINNQTQLEVFTYNYSQPIKSRLVERNLYTNCTFWVWGESQ